MNSPIPMNLEVIAARGNPGPQELPVFLGVVCQDLKDVDHCWVPRQDGSLDCWDLAAVQEQLSEGHWYQLPRQHAYRPRARLLFLNQDKPPEYLSPSYARNRLKHVALESLQRAHSHWSEIPDVLTELFYAARAVPDDPLPLQLAAAIVRKQGDTEYANDLMLEVKEQFSPPTVCAAWDRARQYASFVGYIPEDLVQQPRSTQVPEWLDSHKNCRGFIKEQRQASRAA